VWAEIAMAADTITARQQQGEELMAKKIRKKNGNEQSKDRGEQPTMRIARFTTPLHDDDDDARAASEGSRTNGISLHHRTCDCGRANSAPPRYQPYNSTRRTKSLREMRLPLENKGIIAIDKRAAVDLQWWVGKV